MTVTFSGANVSWCFMNVSRECFIKSVFKVSYVCFYRYETMKQGFLTFHQLHFNG